MLERTITAEEPRALLAGEALADATDDELRALIEDARQLLQQRENGRKREAIATIKALAKEHSLSVAINEPKRRRGRPPKKPDG